MNYRTLRKVTEDITRSIVYAEFIKQQKNGYYSTLNQSQSRFKTYSKKAFAFIILA